MNSVQHPRGAPSSDPFWLTFGCCAPQCSADHSPGITRSVDSTERVCYDQPHNVPYPQMDVHCYGPGTPPSHMSQWAASSREFAARATSRSRQGGSRSRSRSRRGQRSITIGPPTDFRRGTEVPRRRRSFRPLELSIYMPSGRLSPLPDFSGWDVYPDGLPVPKQAFIPQHYNQPSFDDHDAEVPGPLGDTCCMSIGSDTTLRDSLSLPSTLDPASFVFPEPTRSIAVNRPRRSSSLAASALSGPIPSLASPLSFASPLPSLVSPPPSATTTGRFRIRSNTSPASASRTRGPKSSKSDIDEAIRELNTIVEEKRLDALRLGNGAHGATASTTDVRDAVQQHIPAIAPTMRVRARSETLSDIGSALSTPLGPKRFQPASDALVEHDAPSEAGTADEEFSLDAASSDVRQGLLKVPLWLKRSTSLTAAGPTAVHRSPQSFYQCVPPERGMLLQPLHSPSHHQPTRMALRGNPVSGMGPRSPLHRRATESSESSVDSFDSLPSLSSSTSPSVSENATVTSPCSPDIRVGLVEFPLPPSTSPARLAMVHATEEQERRKMMLASNVHNQGVVGLAL